MKLVFSIWLVFVSLGVLGQQEVKIDGNTILINSNKAPLAGVSVIVKNVGIGTSDNEGKFRLVVKPSFIAKIEADRNNLGLDNTTVYKTGYELVNTEELNQYVFNKTVNPNNIHVYFAKKGYLDSARLTLFNISLGSYNQRLARLQLKVNSAQSDKHRWQDAYNSLKDSLVYYKQNSEMLSKIMAKYNFDDLSEKFKKAFDLFINGQLQLALNILNDRDLDDDLQNATNLQAEGKNQIKQVLYAKKLKAELYLFNGKPDSCAYYYKQCFDIGIANNCLDPVTFDEFIKYFETREDFIACGKAFEKTIPLKNSLEDKAVAYLETANYFAMGLFKEFKTSKATRAEINYELVRKMIKYNDTSKFIYKNVLKNDSLYSFELGKISYVASVYFSLSDSISQNDLDFISELCFKGANYYYRAYQNKTANYCTIKEAGGDLSDVYTFVFEQDKAHHYYNNNQLVRLNNLIDSSYERSLGLFKDNLLGNCSSSQKYIPFSDSRVFKKYHETVIDYAALLENNGQYDAELKLLKEENALIMRTDTTGYRSVTNYQALVALAGFYARRGNRPEVDSLIRNANLIYSTAGLKSLFRFDHVDASRRLRIAECFINMADASDLIERIISPIYDYNFYSAPVFEDGTRPIMGVLGFADDLCFDYIFGTLELNKYLKSGKAYDKGNVQEAIETFANEYHTIQSHPSWNIRLDTVKINKYLLGIGKMKETVGN